MPKKSNRKPTEKLKLREDRNQQSEYSATIQRTPLSSHSVACRLSLRINSTTGTAAGIDIYLAKHADCESSKKALAFADSLCKGADLIRKAVAQHQKYVERRRDRA